MPELLPYQVYGANWLKDRYRAGLHDEMGIGKTATVIAAVEMKGARRGIVICPSGLRANWIGEYHKFGKTELRLCKARTIHDFVAWSRNRYDVLVVGYEMATKWRDAFNDLGEFLDFVIIDEAHYLKSPDAQRTKAIYGADMSGLGGIAQWGLHVYMLTGTPIPNDPIDIYSFLRFVNAMQLGKDAFLDRYFFSRAVTFGAVNTTKLEMIDELKALIENNALRRTHGDVGLQLPSIFLTDSLVDGDTDQIRRWFAEFGAGLSQVIVDAIEAGGLSFLDADHIATLRRLVGVAKAVPYARMLYEELCFTTDKRVVYGIHTEALSHVHESLNAWGIQAVLFVGATSDYEREHAVYRFQNDPKTRVFIGNIRAAGTGHTLTAACEIDVMESDWSPAGNAQAIKRVHRIGQEKKVRARFITLANTIDEHVNAVVARKTAAIAQIEGVYMHAAPSLLT